MKTIEEYKQAKRDLNEFERVLMISCRHFAKGSRKYKIGAVAIAAAFTPILAQASNPDLSGLVDKVNSGINALESADTIDTARELYAVLTHTMTNAHVAAFEAIDPMLKGSPTGRDALAGGFDKALQLIGLS